MVTNYNTLTLSQVLALNEKGYTFELNDGSIKEINRELSSQRTMIMIIWRNVLGSKEPAYN